jgi:hypothetical protein
MIEYIKKLITDHKVTDPAGLPDIYLGTQRGYVVGKPTDVDSFPSLVVVTTTSGNAVGVVISNILFVSQTEPEMESAGL